MKRAILVLLILGLAMFFGVLERESVLVQDAMLKDPQVLRYPLPCSATVAQRGAGEQWITRCYIGPSAK